MMEFTNLTMQLQSANWGWSIAFFLWFIGLSGMGMFLNGWVREKALVYLCAIASILGTLLVVSHLARLTNLPVAAFYALTSSRCSAAQQCFTLCLWPVCSRAAKTSC